MKSKRALAFLVFVLAIVMTVLFIGFVNVMEGNVNKLGKDMYIGQSQMDMLNLFSEGEIDGIYYRMIGDNILPRSLYLTGIKGGFENTSLCGVEGNYNLWINITDECYPPYKLALDYYLQESFDMYNVLIEEVTGEDYNPEFVFSAFSDSGTVVDAVPLKPHLYTKDMVTYAFKPSFTTYSDYEINIYETIFEESVKLKDDCINKVDYEQCVLDRVVHLNAMSNDFIWEDDCNRNEERVFYTFVEKYKNCIESVWDDCVCDINMDLNGDFGQEGEYEIKVFKNGTVVMNNFEYDFETDLLGYYNENPSGMEESDEIVLEIKYEKGIFVHQKMTSPTDMDFIGLYKDYIDEYNDKQHLVLVENSGDRKECGIFPRTAKVCAVERKEREIFTDEKENVSIPIKFGIYFNDIFPPPALEKVLVKDKIKDENEVSISFYRSKAEDIYEYRFYISETAFNSVEGMEPVFTLYDEMIEDNIHSIDLHVDEDFKQYYFAVTPVDVFGNENKEVESVVGTSIDDLAPGTVEITSPSGVLENGFWKVNVISSINLKWNIPTVNENGKKLIDLGGYFVFFFKVSDGTFPLSGTLEEMKLQCKENEECEFTSQDFISKNLENGPYYIKVVATDEMGNVMKDLNIVQETTTITIDGQTSNIFLPTGGKYYFPVMNPTISSCYGWRTINGKSDWHDGIDFAVSVGTPVFSIASGVVIETCYTSENIVQGGVRKCRGFGSNILIKHDDGTYARYSHLSSVEVSKGERVSQTQPIGKSGNTGYSYGPHLDFKLYLGPVFKEVVNDYSRNPLCYFPPVTGYTSSASSCTDSDGNGMQYCF